MTEGKLKRLLIAASLAALPFAAFAAGSDDPQPPTATETTTECKTGEVWDEKTSACIKAEDSSLNDDQRYNAVRELAYAGRYPEALAMLDTMTEGDTARVMTYRGFALRKSGQVEQGIAAYEQAIAMDPANILARSYYGQLLVEMNEMDLAQIQLAGIRSHDGAGTWAERALATAIATGVTYTY